MDEELTKVYAKLTDNYQTSDEIFSKLEGMTKGRMYRCLREIVRIESAERLDIVDSDGFEIRYKRI